jgi:hypothetical protein
VEVLKEHVLRVAPASLPTIAYNDAGHAGQPGDWVWLHFDKTRKNSSGAEQPGWYVFDVTHKEQWVTTDVRFVSEGCKWEKKRRKLSVESCADETPWETYVTGEDC